MVVGLTRDIKLEGALVINQMRINVSHFIYPLQLRLRVANRLS